MIPFKCLAVLLGFLEEFDKMGWSTPTPGIPVSCWIKSRLASDLSSETRRWENAYKNWWLSSVHRDGEEEKRSSAPTLTWPVSVAVRRRGGGRGGGGVTGRLTVNTPTDLRGMVVSTAPSVSSTRASTPAVPSAHSAVPASSLLPVAWCPRAAGEATGGGK